MEENATAPPLIDDTWTDLNAQVDTIKGKWQIIADFVDNNKLRHLLKNGHTTPSSINGLKTE
jgi:hypothetical protein